MFVNSKIIKKGLYIVSTQIVNLADITIRGLEILKNSEFILCEDTRISKNLFNRYEINSKLISNHKFSEKKNLSKIVDLLKLGKIVSLISDAGTPCISDPGNLLLRECLKNNINIIPIPGASAVTAAVSVSGFSEKYFFYGFFPEKQKILNEDLNILSQINCSIVFFVSPKKFKKIIPILKNKFKDREILICREMTKLYEEFIRTSVNKLEMLDKEFKGEVTLVISENYKNKNASQELGESGKRLIDSMINKLSIKEITTIINSNNKIPKKEIYNYCLKIKNEK